MLCSKHKEHLHCTESFLIKTVLLGLLIDIYRTVGYKANGIYSDCFKFIEITTQIFIKYAKASKYLENSSVLLHKMANFHSLKKCLLGDFESDLSEFSSQFRYREPKITIRISLKLML